MTTSTQSDLPSALNSERVVLGSVLLDNDALYEVASVLRATDFEMDAHRRIFHRMTEMALANDGIDIVTLTASLTRSNEIAAIGGVPYLSELTTGIASRMKLETHVKEVVDASTRRQAITQADRMKAALLDRSESTSDCLSLMHDYLLNVEGNQRKQQAVAIRDYSDDVRRELKAQADSNREVMGVPTGIPALDEMTTGIRNSELWLLGGRPGKGKTALMLQIATSAAGYDQAPIGIFSLEMRKEELLKRLWASEGRIQPNRMRKPKDMTSADWRQLDAAKAVCDQWPMHIDDSTGLTAQQIVARAYLMLRKHNVALIMLDYIQKVRGLGRDRRERVTEVSNALMHFAKESKCPVLALSQLTRSEKEDEDPRLSDLKESGDLEADADTVLLLNNQQSKIIIAKQRNGSEGVVNVELNRSTLFFEQVGAKDDSQKALQYSD